MRQSKLKFCVSVAALLGCAPLARAVPTSIYVSPVGFDIGTLAQGTIANPYKTISKAIGVAAAGDSIFVRGNAGSFAMTGGSLNISKSGTAANPFNLFAYPGDPAPVLDFSGQTNLTARGIELKSNYWHIKGLVIQKAHDNGIFVPGSNNILEQLVTRNNGDSGVQISNSGSLSPSNNLVMNCDSYSNYDTGTGTPTYGENADGFAVKFRGLGPGNVLRGNRAWGNSDDGYDFWQAENGVTVDQCWAFKNGVNVAGVATFNGDGNGIKLGHDSGTHTLKNVLVWSNPANGIDVNGNATQLEGDAPLVIPHGVQILNVTAYNNGGKNFNFDENPTTATPPTNHILRNNLSVAGGGTTVMAGNTQDHNSWNGISFSNSNFYSLNDAIATGPRLPDGSLPISGFLRPKTGNLIDAGVNVGSPFAGAAPDIGAFEVGLPRFGDADLDGDTDGVDIGTWATNFTGELGGGAGATKTWTQGDWDFDGDVDGVDAGIWAAAFTGELGGGGTGVLAINTPLSPEAAQVLAALGITVVPEPGSIVCVALSVCIALPRRWRRWRRILILNRPSSALLR